MVGRVDKRVRLSNPASKGCVGFSKWGSVSPFQTYREKHGIVNAIENGFSYANVIPMTATVTLDKAGRLVLPKPVRDQLHLRAGSKLRLDVIGDHMELTQEVPEVQIVRRGKRRVVVGWEGFDAAKAVREMREEQVARLESSSGA